MIIALINGIIGLTLSIYLGTEILDLSLLSSLNCVLAANIAGFTSLLFTLKAEKTSWIKKYLLNRTLKTWGFLSIIFFGILFIFEPNLKNFKILSYLILPLILSTGFMIVLFGPIQDALQRREQKEKVKK